MTRIRTVRIAVSTLYVAAILTALLTGHPGTFLLVAVVGGVLVGGVYAATGGAGGAGRDRPGRRARRAARRR